MGLLPLFENHPSTSDLRRFLRLRWLLDPVINQSVKEILLHVIRGIARQQSERVIEITKDSGSGAVGLVDIDSKWPVGQVPFLRGL